MRKPLAEFLGTYCLVFAGAGAIVADEVTGGGVTHVGVALTFGLVVLAMIYAFGDVSGAHLNPAVSIGFWLARRFETRQLPGYLVAQLLGAVAASYTLRFLFPASGSLGVTSPSGAAWQSFLLEVILTAMLMLVILAVSIGSKEKGTMAGIAVGGTIALEALFAGPISGASMNPARSIGPAVASGLTNDLWIYLGAPVFGAALAVPIAALVWGQAPPAPDERE
jgi:aquaporin NIP